MKYLLQIEVTAATEVVTRELIKFMIENLAELYPETFSEVLVKKCNKLIEEKNV